MEYISRHIESTVLEMAKYFPVIVITGPRQSGKTTLIKHLFGEYLQFSMEDLHIREFAEQDPVAFLEQNKQGMIIDEVQRVPTLMSYIQGIVDKFPSRRFILSGSSNFAMLQSVTQSLAGRAAILELLPMSIPEISDFAKSLSLDGLIYGGMYPAVCAQKIPPEFAYPSYVKTYLERDVRNLLRISNLSAYEKFLKLC
ncbi:MAG: AAA family ATPase, partial [Muribaculaceae bacterium]|nr:AAA family ATPase [Muribaculaceae bacterium]